MLVSEIQLFQILKQKLGEKEAEALIEYVDYRLKESNESNSKILATKEDIADLKIEMEKRFTEQFKWMFGLIVGLFVALVGSLVAIIKFMVH